MTVLASEKAASAAFSVPFRQSMVTRSSPLPGSYSGPFICAQFNTRAGRDIAQGTNDYVASSGQRLLFGV
jgi:hypothetical protein